MNLSFFTWYMQLSGNSHLSVRYVTFPTHTLLVNMRRASFFQSQCTITRDKDCRMVHAKEAEQLGHVDVGHVSNSNSIK